MENSISEKDVIKLYWQGYTIDRLVKLVASADKTTRRKAREYVEYIIYCHLMQEKQHEKKSDT